MMGKHLVISDIHDNNESIEKLYDAVNDQKFDSIIFCGDAVAPFTINSLIKKFEDITSRYLIVLGNNEGEVFKIVKDISDFSDTRIVFSKDFIITDISNYKALITHGWGSIELTRAIIESLGKSGDYKLIFFGHTHQSEITLIKTDNVVQRVIINDSKKTEFKLNLKELKALIINPGELGGWLTGKKSYVLLELDNNFITLSTNFI